MIDRLRAIIPPRTPASVVYECRHCGQTLDRSRPRCPACQSEEIACYDL